MLVVDREEIVARRGPIQCAAETLARTMGIGSRSIFKRKAEGPSLALTPTAFSRHVSKLGLLKYALSLFGPLDAHDENAVREWMHKRRLRRDSGRQLWDHQIGNRLGSRCVRWVSLQSVMPHRDYGFDGPASTCRGSSPPPQLVSRPFRRDDYGAG